MIAHFDVGTFLKFLPQGVAAGAFLWGVVQYFRAEQERRETRRLEARKPFLELQLKIYSDVVHAIALIASNEQGRHADSELVFYEMFWGKMA